MKRKLFFIAVIVICLSLTAYGTLAYFTAEDTAHNVITTGDVDIELLEWADEDKTETFPKEGVSGVMPNTSVTKIVEIKNTGSGSAWVRIKVEKDITLAEGVGLEKPDLGLMVIDYDTENWILMKDGYYHYKKPLESGQTTEPLFAEVTFDKTMGNDYQNATASVLVSAEAVQSANNGATYDQAKGWPTT